MSEPTIKPVGYRCPKCLHMAYESLRIRGPWIHCSFCDVDTEPMFGPDDLVAAVEAAMVSASYSGDIKGHAIRVVERLTGVKR